MIFNPNYILHILVYITNNKWTPLPPANVLGLLDFELRITSAVRLEDFLTLGEA